MIASSSSPSSSPQTFSNSRISNTFSLQNNKIVDFEAVWNGGLERNILALFRHENVGEVSAIQLYNDIYSLCIAKPSPFTERLLVSIETLLSRHTLIVCDYLVLGGQQLREYSSVPSHAASQIIPSSSLSDCVDIVSRYADQWLKFKTASHNFNTICGYLNKVLVSTGGLSVKSAQATRAEQVASVYYSKNSVESVHFHCFVRIYLLLKISSKFWKVNVLDELRMKHGNLLMRSIFELIRKDRVGEEVSHDQLRLAISSLVEVNRYIGTFGMKLYLEDFEGPLCEATLQFYTDESKSLIAHHSTMDYLKLAKARLLQEDQRCTRLYHDSSKAKIILICESALIKSQEERIHEEFRCLLLQESILDLKFIFELESRIDGGLEKLALLLEQYCAEKTRQTLNVDAEQARKDNGTRFVKTILELNSKFSYLVQNAFDSNILFKSAAEKALRGVINTLSSSPELLAKFSDANLRKTKSSHEHQDEMSESDVINATTSVLKFIDDKDIFQKHYSRLLAKRLVFGTSISQDFEAQLIKGLQTVCGLEYTSKLQRMFADVGMSTDLSAEFAEMNSQGSSFEFTPLILTSGAWPLTANVTSEFNLSSRFEGTIKSFINFYNGKYQGRKLMWLHHLSKVEIRCHCFDRRYEVLMSLFQSGVMLCFNSTDSITARNLLLATGLSESELFKSIRSLVELGLVKSEAGKENLDAEVSLNLSFTSKRMKLRTAISAQSDESQDNDVSKKHVDEDRRLLLQATIVRVMKSKKKVSHTNLVQEVIDLCKDRFKPSVPMIKRCIEQLIDQQYLERSKEKDVYDYVA